MKLKVSEIFESINGEVGLFPQGSPATFLRLVGCNCTCTSCEVKETMEEGPIALMDLDDIVENILSRPWHQIVITGGEPLLQRQPIQQLIFKLKGHLPHTKIQLRTNGTVSIDNFWRVDGFLVSMKCHDARGGTPYHFAPGNIFQKNVWVNCLVGSLEDLDSAIGFCSVVLRPYSPHYPHLSISPVDGTVTYQDILQCVLASKLPITVNAPLHKIIGAR